MIRLVIVDDHILMREGLKQLFEHVEDIIVSAESHHGKDLIKLLFDNKFDLILLDVSMPGTDTFELVQRISAFPDHPPILILTMHDELQTARRMFKAGVKGYITKNSNSHELVNAIRKVAKGGRYVGSELSEHLFFDINVQPAIQTHHALTKRELSILKMLVNGRKVTEIAHDLGLSVKTVSAHKINIKHKMHIDNDAQLIRYAIGSEL